MTASDSFADFLREQLAGVGHVTLRRMFGKTGVFCDGLMLAMVRDEFIAWARAALGAARRVAAKRDRATPKRKTKRK